MTKLKSYFKKILKGKLAKLVSGTALGHLINIISLPILSRLYTPEQYGDYAIFFSYCSIFLSAVSFRLEFKIQEIPDKEKLAFLSSVFFLSTFISIICSALFFIFVVYDLIGYGALNPLMTFVVFFFFVCHSAFLLLRYYKLSHSEYSSVARMEIDKSIGRSTSQIALGLVTSFNFLAIGDVLSRLFPVTKIILQIRTQLVASLSTIRYQDVKQLMKDHYGYSIKGVITTIINALSFAIIIPLLSQTFNEAAAGEYAFIYRVLTLPMALVGMAVADAFQNDYLSSQSKWRTFKKYSRNLLLVSLVLFSSIYLIGGPVLSFVLGPEWTMVEQLVRPLCMMLFAAFIVSPVSRVLYPINKVNLKLIYDIASLSSIIIVFQVSGWMTLTVVDTIWLMSGIMSFNYLIYYLLISRAIKSDISAE